MKTKMRELTAEEYLELSRDEALRTVDKVMTEFDFKKAHRALKGCGWKYSGAENSPSVAELKEIAHGILKHAIESGSRCTVGQGPLEAQTNHYDTPAVVTVTLRLIPVYGGSVYVDGRVIFARKGRKYVSAKGHTSDGDHAREELAGRDPEPGVPRQQGTSK